MPAVNPLARRRCPNPEMLRRVGRVESWSGNLYVSADRDRRDLGRRSLHGLKLNGSLIESVSGVAAFELTVCSDPRASASAGDVPAIGSWLKVKPMMDGLVMLTEREFDLVLALVAGDRLVSVGLSFHKPRYGRGAITRVDFSTESLAE